MAGMLKCNSSKFPMEPKLHLTIEDEGIRVNGTEFRSIIWNLRYLVHTRTDIGYAVGVMSRFMASPKVGHLKAVKQILRYVKGTVNLDVFYKGGGDGKLLGYSDRNHGMDVDDRKGTTEMVFYFSGNIITWNSSKQRTVTL
ncbi:secreted RxLR effector protein 161-like [Rutidosis leptorrhynchoides]|uniref:secreted RxLR effector protein 161-like n=1 Tax=Rutidosis leptorrhynchoides TaxID=125765 RepID=UPI003A999E63